MSTKRIVLTFHTTQKEQALVYEYLNKLGRRKTKKITDVLVKEIEKEDIYLKVKHDLIEELLKDDLFIERIKNNINVESSHITNNELVDNVDENDSDTDFVLEGLSFFMT